MKILFDARWIKPEKPDGISRFSSELVKKLANKVDLTLLVAQPAQSKSFGNIKTIMTNSPSSLKELFQAKNINKHEFDIVYSPYFLFGGWGKKFKLILTVHDLIPLRGQSQTGSASLMRKLFFSNKFFIKLSLSMADRLMTVSQTSANELKNLTDKPIDVIYNAPIKMIQKSSIPKKQLFYIGRYEPYKNVELLIKSIKQLPQYKLILAGKIDPSRQQQLLDVCEDQSRVEFIGVIDDKKYNKLLNESFAAVNASFDEGFGLPIIEAMAAGTPVVCSNLAVYKEITGGEAEFFNPTSIDELVKGLKRLEEDDYRKKRIKKALQRSAAFSWDKSCNQLITVFNKVVESDN